MAAGLTPQTDETPGENPTIEERAEFVFNKSRNRMIAFLPPAQESFQLFGDDLIESCLFRIAWYVLRCEIPHASERGSGIPLSSTTAVYNLISR